MCDQQTALDELRVLKTRLDVEITTDGRETGQNITFRSKDNPDAPTYEDYKMRRKAEVLKYNSHGRTFSKKQKQSMLVRGRNKYNLPNTGNKTFIMTQSNKKNYIRSNGSLILTNSSGSICTRGQKMFPGTNSDIPVSNNELFYIDDDVPYQSQL